MFLVTSDRAYVDFDTDYLMPKEALGIQSADPTSSIVNAFAENALSLTFFENLSAVLSYSNIAKMLENYLSEYPEIYAFTQLPKFDARDPQPRIMALIQLVMNESQGDYELLGSSVKEKYKVFFHQLFIQMQAAEESTYSSLEDAGHRERAGTVTVSLSDLALFIVIPLLERTTETSQDRQDFRPRTCTYLSTAAPIALLEAAYHDLPLYDEGNARTSSSSGVQAKPNALLLDSEYEVAVTFVPRPEFIRRLEIPLGQRNALMADAIYEIEEDPTTTQYTISEQGVLKSRPRGSVEWVDCAPPESIKYYCPEVSSTPTHLATGGYDVALDMDGMYEVFPIQEDFNEATYDESSEEMSLFLFKQKFRG